MRARSFFYAAAGLFLLVAAYSIGAHRADAQSGGQFVALTTTEYSGTTMGYLAITATGDCYGNIARISCVPGGTPSFDGSPGCSTWGYMGNVLGGSVQVQAKSMSDVKGSYRR